MSDIRRVYVWIRLPGGKSCPLGEIATQMDEEGGRIQGQFRYADDWLDHPDGFNIDPANLAWVSGPQDAGRPREGIHSVFEDALPDDWGQQMMAVIHNLSRRQMRLPDLLPLMEYRALGALMFSDTPVIDEPPASAKEAAVEMGKQWYAGMVSGFEQELAVRNDKHRQKLVDVASSPGGARPKFLYTESREDGLTHYLVKLSSKSDQYPVIRLEAACLRAAQACGIETPACRLVWYDDIGVEALSIVRFDVTPEGGRRHMVSLKTLMHAEYYYSKAYTDILYVLRKYSDDPENDSVRLFRQMLYNALIGNRDDHLRNFTLLHDDTGWRLSPGYDITPLFPLGDNEPHVLRFGLKDNTRPGANELKNLASTFGLSPARARTETERVMSSIEELRDAMALFGVPDEPAELVLGHAAAYRDRLSAKARRRPGTR